MTEKPSANFEMTIVLPLGVVANKLQRIEAELRLLNLKASSFAGEREREGSSKLIEARLEDINETLESIKRLVSDFEFDERTAPSVPHFSSDDEYPLKNRKHRPELDD
jgi:hypothetical protein